MSLNPKHPIAFSTPDGDGFADYEGDGNWLVNMPSGGFHISGSRAACERELRYRLKKEYGADDFSISQVCRN